MRNVCSGYHFFFVFVVILVVSLFFVYCKVLVLKSVYLNSASSWLFVLLSMLSFVLPSGAAWHDTCIAYLQCSTSLLWQSIVVFSTELHDTSPNTVCQSPKFLIASICDLQDVINCQFREFAAALLGPVHFLSPGQQSGIHCLIICAIQLSTPDKLGGTWEDVSVRRTFETLAH